MQLLRELLSFPSSGDKYVPKNAAVAVSEEVSDIVDVGPDYVPMMKPGSTTKKKKRRPPTTDKAENSLINTLWFYNNSDAS